jgi:outer membrane protein assembly factor BamB
MWSVNFNDSVRSAPVVGPDGTIYAGSNSGAYAALTPLGAIKWTVDIGDSNDIGSSACLSADGSRLFVGSDSDSVYALDTATGATVWTATTGG